VQFDLIEPEKDRNYVTLFFNYTNQEGFSMEYSLFDQVDQRVFDADNVEYDYDDFRNNYDMYMNRELIIYPVKTKMGLSGIGSDDRYFTISVKGYSYVNNINKIVDMGIK
jgi:hypothetical protein